MSSTLIVSVVELYYGGVWNDVTSYVYHRDGINITRGRQDEAGDLEPGTLTLTLNNRDGRFSPRNPASPLYGNVGRNTPIRVTTSGSVRFTGEVSSLPQRWDLSGKDIWVPLEASGITRRVGQRGRLEQSATSRLVSANLSKCLNYWPLDDEEGSWRAGSAIGKEAMTNGWLFDNQVGGNYNFVKYAPPPLGLGKVFDWGPNTFETSTGGMDSTSAGGYLEGNVTAGSYGGWSLDCTFRAEKPDSVLDYSVDVFVAMDDSKANRWGWHSDAPNQRIIMYSRVYHVENIATVFAAPQLYDGLPHHVRVASYMSGTQQGISVWVDGVLLGSAPTRQINTSLTPAPTTASISWASYNGTRKVAVVSMGDLVAWNSTGPTAAAASTAAHGYANTDAGGERAGDRMARLCSEEGITFTYNGTLSATVPMGPQMPDTFLNLMNECAAADHGYLVEKRDGLGYHYTTLAFMNATTPGATLSYTAGNIAHPFIPSEDDQNTVNDVTVGSPASQYKYKVTDTETPLSTLAPPTGVGPYPKSLNYNVFADAGLPDQATWALYLGTLADPRFPELNVNMRNSSITSNPTLKTQLLGMDAPGLIKITGTPSWVSSEDIYLLIQGYTEYITREEHKITFNATPAYKIASYYASTGNPTPDERSRYAPNGSVTSNTITTGTNTTMGVNVAGGMAWTTQASHFPLDIVVAGVRIRVTAATTPSSNIQTFTIQQAPVNGIIKTIPSGTPVDIYNPSYRGF